MDFEITLTTSANGWHWTVTSTDDNGRRFLVAESDQALDSTADAAEEAEKAIRSALKLDL